MNETMFLDQAYDIFEKIKPVFLARGTALGFSALKTDGGTFGSRYIAMMKGDAAIYFEWFNDPQDSFFLMSRTDNIKAPTDMRSLFNKRMPKESLWPEKLVEDVLKSLKETIARMEGSLRPADATDDHG